MLENLISTIRETLPSLASRLIRHHLDQSLPHNQEFAEHPDSYWHHKPMWHEWGVITHTNKFLEAFEQEEKELLEEWGLHHIIEEFMEPIDGIPKKDLMKLGILLHDLGKFTLRHLSKKQVSKPPLPPDFSFGGHELESERIIHSDYVKPLLREGGLKDSHIIYIGRCAALHYELAKIRNHIFSTGYENYTIAFIEGDEHKKLSQKLADENPYHRIEVGIMYLGDSLAKTSFRTFKHGTPTEEEMDAYIQEKDLDPRYKAQIIHSHIAVASAKAYLSSL